MFTVGGKGSSSVDTAVLWVPSQAKISSISSHLEETEVAWASATIVWRRTAPPLHILLLHLGGNNLGLVQALILQTHEGQE